MKRRTFLKSCVVVIGACFIKPVAKANGMSHLYDNGEGELVAANSAKDAADYYNDLVGDPNSICHVPVEEWIELDDESLVPIANQDDGGTLTNTAKEWAQDCSEPTQVATTYW